MDKIREWNGQAIRTSPPIKSDHSSLLGWGLGRGICNRQLLVSTREAPPHQQLGIDRRIICSQDFHHAFTEGKENLHVRLKMDNTTAIAYMNHMQRNQIPKLSSSALVVVPLKRDSSAEWRLDPQIFQTIMQKLGLYSVSLSCTSILVCELEANPFAIATDELKIH